MIKTLVCGPVLGHWDQWQARVQAVNKSHGPFELVLCVGNLFGSGADAGANAQVLPYVNGDKRIDIETLFVHSGPTPMPLAVVEAIDARDGYVCDNLLFLGQSGLLTTASGLRIAYLSGSSSSSSSDDKYSLGLHYSAKDLLTLKKVAEQKGFEGVDFLLTPGEWPRGVANVPSVSAASGSAGASADSSTGTDAIADLAKELRPRYHFVASTEEGPNSTYYERPPYKNVPIIPGRQIHVTRFFGMASCGNTSKAKWLMALNMVPLTQLDTTELVAEPAGTTLSPYIKQGYKRSGTLPQPGDDISASGSYFFAPDQRASNSKRGRHGGGPIAPPSTYVCRICNVPGHFIRDCPDKQQSSSSSSGRQDRAAVPRKTGCWFCLANPEVEKHLIASVGREVYMALAKGGLTADHVLIIPTGHFPASPELPPHVHKELEQYKQALRDAFKSVNKAVIFYEVNVKSQHMHIQALPVPIEWVSSDLTAKYVKQGEEAGLEFIDEADGDLTQQFFRLEIPTATASTKVLFHQVQPNARFPFQFGRQVVAKLSGQPGRAEWKACVKPADAESADVGAFKSFFKSFDFSLSYEDDDD